MALSAIDGRRVLEWVRVRCPDLRCPACLGTILNAAELINVPMAPQPAGAEPVPAVPMIAVVCTFCAYLQFFSAAMMGITPAGAAAAPAPTPTAGQTA